uniref:WRC domain-containing protein n=1 Tax=Physcomitrium patens TaxID=3218 RepID=A0A7I4C119_PHYPA
MRIRKGHRCLPLAPADRSFLQESSVQRGNDGGSIGDGKDDGVQAKLLRLVEVAAAPVANVSSGRHVYLENMNEKSLTGEECQEPELENRVSADDNFIERSIIHDTSVDTTLRNPTELSPRAKSIFTRHKPFDTSGTTCSSVLGIGIENQQDLLERSLRQICSTAGRGRYCLAEYTSLVSGESMTLFTGDSEISRENTVSSSDVVDAARQLQNLQKIHSTLLGSGVDVLNESPCSHGSNRQANLSIVDGFVRHPKAGTVRKDVTATNHKASSTHSRSQTLAKLDPNEPQCRRDDGKGWRCSRSADAGFAMCKYHREQIYRAQNRRKKSKRDVEPTALAGCSPPRYVANARAVPDDITAGSTNDPFLDDELPFDERRQFVKAKSLKSLLLNSDVRSIGRRQI